MHGLLYFSSILRVGVIMLSWQVSRYLKLIYFPVTYICQKLPPHPLDGPMLLIFNSSNYYCCSFIRAALQLDVSSAPLQIIPKKIIFVFGLKLA